MYKFDIIAEVFDYGESVTAVVADMQQTIQSELLKTSMFSCQARNLDQEDKIYYQGQREILDVYMTNHPDQYRERKASGQYLVILLKTGYQDKASASIYYNIVMKDGIIEFFKCYNLELKLNYTITQLEDISSANGIIQKGALYEQRNLLRPSADKFSREVSRTGLQYRKFVPEIRSERHPLIVWFHGSGEGGSNNSSQILGNRGAVAFAAEAAQQIFNGAYVIAPQCPDNWAIDPEVLASINIPVSADIKASRDYAKDAIALIREMMDIHPDIDPRRIYIIGCSAGGAMTWKTLLADPALFAAAVPICGSLIKKEDLEKAVNVPVWMIHSKDDPTVTCQNSELNYENLQALGGQVQLTEYEQVMIDGQKYPGHWSWIYALNNDPKLEDGTTLFEWMSQQSRSN